MVREVYTSEEIDQGLWAVIDENKAFGSGMCVLDFQTPEAAKFYAKLMNLVYNRVMEDIKKGLTYEED